MAKSLSRLLLPQQRPSPLALSLREGALVRGKTLITGGTAADRTPLLALAAAQAGDSVTVLHRRGPRLEKSLRRRAGLYSQVYDPLRCREPEDAAELLCACADTCGFDGNGMFLFLTDILQWIQGDQGSLSIFSLLRRSARGWNQLLMEEDEHFLDSHVTEKAVNELSRFLVKLKLAFPTPAEGVSLAFPEGICVNIGESTLSWHLALLELLRVQQDRDVQVILDHPPVDEVLLELAERDWEEGMLMVSGPDLPAVQNHWSRLCASLDAIVAFHHESGLSCDALAQYFGQCERIRTDQNVNVSQANTAFLTKTYSSGAVNRSVREYSILPEQIQTLPEGHAAIRIRSAGQAICALQAREEDDL